MSVLLLMVIIWLIRQLLMVLKENNQVIQNLTKVIEGAKDSTESLKEQIAADQRETRKEYRLLKEEIANRPCWAKIKVVEESAEFEVQKETKRRKP